VNDLYAVGMVFDNRALTTYLPHATWVEWGSVLLVVAGTLGLAHWRNAWDRRVRRLVADL
jgi:hypothetical protein